MPRPMRLVTLAFTITFIALVICALAIWQTLRTYQVLTHRDVVATIECIPSPARADEFRLVYRPMIRGRSGPAQVFQLYGDEWSIGGDLLIWKGWALLAGQKTWYKVTRVEGRGKTHNYLVYDVDGGRDWLWKALYQLPDWIPGVETVYGGSVYMAPDPRKRYIVYVTPTGFMVKAHRRFPKYPLPPAQSAFNET